MLPHKLILQVIHRLMPKLCFQTRNDAIHIHEVLHLKELKSRGVKIFTCGTCLNYYELSDKLAVGEVTNMYDIAEKMAGASLIVSP